MATKRRLPVLNNPPSAPEHAPAEGGDTPPPPWHWVPLGAMISIAVGAVLVWSFYVPFAQRLSDRVYGRLASRADYDRVDAALSTAARDAFHFKLAMAGFLVAMVSVAVGGLVVGRFGARTNARHGTLAGITAMLLLVLYAGHGTGLAALVGYIALIPFGGLVGYLGALLGVRLRIRAQA
jgi:hypothetical protein